MTRFIVAVVMLAACAGAPRGSRAVTPAQWRRQLPRAAEAAGIRAGGVTYTLAHMVVSPGYTRTTPTGCEFDRSFLLLRIGHVMPRLSASATPSADDRAGWDTFVAALWKRAHLSEEVGQRLADSIRVEVRRERAQECAPLIEQTRLKVEGFGVRYTTAMQAAEAALGEESRPALP
jgi:hypothetical protein